MQKRASNLWSGSKLTIWNLALKNNKSFSLENTIVWRQAYAKIRTELLSWPRWKLVAYISEQAAAAAAAQQPMYQLTFLELEQNTSPAPRKFRVKRKKICTSCPVAAIHISWGEWANLKWFVGREDTIWLLDLDGYDLFNQIPKGFEYNGWVFFHVCPICYWKETPVLWQKRQMAICTARTMEYFFFRQKGYKIKTGSLTRT